MKAEERLIAQYYELVKQRSTDIAEMVAAHGPRPPKVSGVVNTADILGWLASVRLLAQGCEFSAHNGATFRTRVNAAKKIVESADELGL